ncbi:MAG: hypothetical protein JW832_09175, partial [Deltaproteobacteria bacterium]|nr:hypothetical protein [Deltaproteobacteria bacterium]
NELPRRKQRGIFEIATAFGLAMTYWVVIANEVKQSQLCILCAASGGEFNPKYRSPLKKVQKKEVGRTKT